MSVSLVRQNYHGDCEAAVNGQVNQLLQTAYVYDNMAVHFQRDDVALEGFHAFCTHQHKCHRERATKLMDFQTRRGGKLQATDVKRPAQDSWVGGLEAMQAALQLEKDVDSSLKRLHQIASATNDAHTADFIEGEYLEAQVATIKEISDYITALKKVGPGRGEYVFDHETLQKKYKTQE